MLNYSYQDKNLFYQKNFSHISQEKKVERRKMKAFFPQIYLHISELSLASF